MRHVKAFFTRRGMRAISALLTLLLLAPAPALAFTWVQPNWQTLFTVANNVEIAPSFTQADDGDNRGGTLTVDMGKASATTSKPASASIELTRQLRIDGSREDIDVASSFRSLLQDANLAVKVWFEPISSGQGAHTKSIFDFSKSAEDDPRIVSADRTKTRLLREGNAINSGNYVAHVRITYQTSTDGHNHGHHHGRWDHWGWAWGDDWNRGHRNREEDTQYDNHTPGVASAHSFTFRGN